LFDTGSPVSFVKHDVFLNLIQPRVSNLKRSNRKFVNIKGDPFDVLGVVTVDIELRNLNNTFQIDLFVLHESLIAYDIILGRDFIGKEKFLITCTKENNGLNQMRDVANLFEALPFCVVDKGTQLDKIMDNIEADCNSTVRDYLTQLIKEIEKTDYAIIEDDYVVRVHLKDESIFAFAPRRFAHIERLQLRRITDDLLERGIIKNSISPYCSRVVLVRKKNGEPRLCVDLRPLNARVIKQRYKHVLVIVDAFTRFTWLRAVKSTTSRETIEHLRNIFSEYGNPTNIVTDRGTAFTSKEFATFITETLIKHRLIAVASPWANGLVERVNRFLKNLLTKLTNSLTEWKIKLIEAQYIINNTYHSVIKSTPSKLMFGFDLRSHVDYPFAQFTRSLAGIDEDLESQRTSARNTASVATDLIRSYNKMYTDNHSRKPTVYKKGDYVLIRDSRLTVGESAKLKPKYKGPYLVEKCLGNNRYVITDIPGFNLTSRPLNTILSSDKIKYWIKK